MRYFSVTSGRFINRPNRFIANVEIEGKIHTVHVKNTGRCKELLLEGATVYLERSQGTKRKTEFDLIAVEKVGNSSSRLINMDSQIVNDVAEEYLRDIFPLAKIKREVKFKNSRFDFYIEHENRKIFVEGSRCQPQLNSIWSNK